MNIFVLDENPKIAAEYLCDKHTIKMSLETAQILCSVNHIKGNAAPYRKTHVNHPCVIWAGQSKENYEWLIEHGIEICNQYYERYGKIHKSFDVINWAAQQLLSFKETSLTNFVVCAYNSEPELRQKCLVEGNAVLSYRNYYKMDKKRFAIWRNGEPYWWTQES